MNIINKTKTFIKTLLNSYAKTIIDISKWQCTQDDSRLFNFDIYESSDGIFIIVKASQGTFSDKRYSYYISEIIPRKLAYGTYHFGDMSYNPRESARFYAKQINNLPEDIYKSAKEITRHWLDVENGGFTGNKINGRQWIRDFFDEIEKHTDVKIGIYTSYYGWVDNVEPMPEIHKRDLWQADYDSEPIVPPDWANYKKKWLIWQKCASCTSCGGCGKDYGAASVSIDINWFNGNIDNFNDWLLKDEEEHMPTQEYEELLALITGNRIDINSNTERIEDLENDAVPDKFYISMKCLASPNLRIRETPETGTVVGSIPYLALLKGSGNLIPDSLRRGMWREVKYEDLTGWVADWYLVEV